MFIIVSTDTTEAESPVLSGLAGTDALQALVQDKLLKKSRGSRVLQIPPHIGGISIDYVNYTFGSKREVWLLKTGNGGETYDTSHAYVAEVIDPSGVVYQLKIALTMRNRKDGVFVLARRRRLGSGLALVRRPNSTSFLQ